MEDELRLSLLIVGTIIIVAVLAHGIWKIRKNSAPSTRRKRVEPGQWDETEYRDNSWHTTKARNELDENSDFDDLGLGKVRVVGAEPVDEQAGDATENVSFTAHTDESTEQANQKLYGSVVTNPKPHMQRTHHEEPEAKSEPLPDPPEFLLKQKQEKPDTNNGADTQATNSAGNRTANADMQNNGQAASQAADHDDSRPGNEQSNNAGAQARQEPELESSSSDNTGAQSQGNVDTKEAQKPTSEPQQVLVINVRASDDNPISGAALLPMLLTLGFKFGDQDIFHRHTSADGNGPVLFSLANMFKPGVFDIDNLETFTTVGVSLFMILPVDGDTHQVFNMMHNAARKIADEFDAQILDGRRSVLTKQGLQQYFEKIRDFERRSMLSRA